MVAHLSPAVACTRRRTCQTLQQAHRVRRAEPGDRSGDPRDRARGVLNATNLRTRRRVGPVRSTPRDVPWSQRRARKRGAE